MKPISPWFQTAALLSAIRHALCDLETARPADRTGSLRRHTEPGKTTK
jgi:hypothetical protein